MEIENIVANTVYIHARGCAEFGRSKKWRELLMFPHYKECLALKDNLDHSFEKIYLKEPIGKLLFHKFCNSINNGGIIIDFLADLESFRSCDNMEEKTVLIDKIKKLIDNNDNNQPTTYSEHTNIIEDTAKIIDSDTTNKCSGTETLNNIKSIKEIIPNEILKPIIAELSYAIPFDYFDKCKSCILDFLKEQIYDSFLNSFYFHRYLQWKHHENQPISDNLFRIYRVLGKGGFGEVCAVQNKLTGKMYAIKKMDKKRVKKKRYENLVLNEKKILEKLDNRFVINLAYAYQNKHSLVLVVNLMMGGDLRFHIHLSKPDGMEMNRVTFYSAEILLGLSYLHSLNIIYRDMKPENILLDDFGHVRISDLGLATFISPNKEISSSVGTVGYMAPEVIQHIPYVYGPDWWAFGCVIYEMIEGNIPFRKHKEKITEEEIKNRTIECNILYSSKFTNETIDLCSKYFVVNQSDRLGSKIEDIALMKSHPFFSTICWNLLEIGKVNPPFIPDPNAVYCKDIHEIGEFASVRGVVLSEDDAKFHAKFATGSVTVHWQNEIIESGVFRELDRYGPNNGPSRDLTGDPPPPKEKNIGCLEFLKKYFSIKSIKHRRLFSTVSTNNDLMTTNHFDTNKIAKT